MMSQHLVDRRVEVVVDDDVVGQARPIGSSISAFFSRCEHLVAGVTPPSQPAFLFLARRRDDEEQQGVGMQPLHLLGAVDLDLEHDVLVAVGRWRGAAVVVAEELGPLQEPALGDALLERLRSVNT